MRYIVFDTETPNCRNDSICSMGISVVENGVVVDSRYDLVDPEARFDSFNVRLHGISPEMVRGKQTFPQLWEQIEPLFDSGVLVAHNAPFDMGVLAKCFRRYGLRREGDDYACTVRLGRVCLPQAPNHKLNTLCDMLNIPLEHHNAASDSHACAQLLCYYLRQGVPVERYVRHWSYSI